MGKLFLAIILISLCLVPGLSRAQSGTKPAKGFAVWNADSKDKKMKSIEVVATTSPGCGWVDDFHLEGDLDEDICIEIYDRWGKQLFSSNDPNMIWDSQIGGEFAPEGVYYYVIEAWGEKTSGTFTLIR